MASYYCGSAGLVAVVDVVRVSLSDRDLAVMRLAVRLNHLTVRHVHALLFHNLADDTMAKRSISRLTKLGYLDRSERRPPGGSKGGSSQYVYRLGRRGHFLFSGEPYQARRQPVEHSLAVADCVVTLRELERQGLPVHSVLTEPDCHEQMGGEHLKPDLYVETTHPAAGLLHLLCEMDMATQGRKVITDKLTRYLRAYSHASDAEMAKYPGHIRVLFVAVDVERVRELEWLISKLEEEQRPLFRVCMRETLGAILYPRQ
jgi:hypothetical protein